MIRREQWACRCDSSQSSKRSSSWLQNGCRMVVPVLKPGIHPEMERPAILNRSMPCTSDATMSIPVFQGRSEKRNLQISEEVYQGRSSFSRKLCPSAHIGGQVLTLEGQSCSLGRTFTTRLGVLSLVPDSPQWFDWLASLTSFRFLGPAGRFSACRASEKGQYTRR